MDSVLGGRVRPDARQRRYRHRGVGSRGRWRCWSVRVATAVVVELPAPLCPATGRIALPCEPWAPDPHDGVQAARRSPSTCRNQPSSWFQLTKMRLTSLSSQLMEVLRRFDLVRQAVPSRAVCGGQSPADDSEGARRASAPAPHARALRPLHAVSGMRPSLLARLPLFPHAALSRCGVRRRQPRRRAWVSAAVNTLSDLRRDPRRR